MFSARPSPHSVPAFAGPVPGTLHAGPVHVGPIPTTVGNRKRKASGAAEGDDLRRVHAPALPALDGPFTAFDQHNNQAALSALQMLPGQHNAYALHMNLTTSSDTDMSSDGAAPSLGGPRDTSSPASEAYDLPQTPTATSLDLYPGLNRGAANGADREGSMFCGLLGPVEGAMPADAMQTEGEAYSSAAPRHGPHCQDIAQLSVRHDPVSGIAELWATCPSCGAYTRVQEQSDALPYAQYAS